MFCFVAVVAPYVPEFKGVFLSSCLFQHSRVGPCVIVRDRAVHGGEVYINCSQPLAAILGRKCSGYQWLIENGRGLWREILASVAERHRAPGGDWRSSGRATLKLQCWRSTLSSQVSHRDVSTRT